LPLLRAGFTNALPMHVPPKQVRSGKPLVFISINT
jgi:hypothetical protein